MRIYLAFSLVLLMLLAGCAQTEKPADVDGRMEDIEEKIDGLEENVQVLEDKVQDLEGQVEEIKDGMNETGEPVQAQEEADKEHYTFLVKIENVDDSITLSPGVFVAHKPPFSIDYIYKKIPSEMEPLVEYGNNTPFYDYISSQEEAVATYSIDTPLAPGESTSFTLKVPRDRPRETYLSGAMMLVETNDGFALVSNIALFTSGNGAKNSTTYAQNYDAGTEENSAVGSGFAGGQPDPEKGSENIDNGVPTSPQRPVTPHPQVTSPVMKVSITPIIG